MQTAEAVPSRNVVGSRRRAALAIVAAPLLLIATCFAQAPAATPGSVPNPEVQASSPGYLDPLPQDTGAAGLTQALRKLQTTGRLMQVVAHPDDEDGGMLTLEARGKGVQTLLMTLTRGEGGQNKLGSSLFDVLGVLRTLELLASDRYYGVEQRFSRVADFGYSKTADETFQKWGGHDVALADIVRVIRTFRPDVLVARFSGTDNDGHGHHQASAILTREAFRTAADPNRFPEQIKEGLQPWQAKKLYIGNVCGFGAMTCPAENYTVKLNTGQVDPALGMSPVQFAMEGLRHQLSQGAGAWKVDPGDRFTFYKLVDSVLPPTTDKDGHEKDFFDGIDTSLPGLAARLGEEQNKLPRVREELQKVAQQTYEAAQKTEKESPDAKGSLFVGYHGLGTLITEVRTSSLSVSAKDNLLEILDEKQRQAETAVGLSLGISIEATVANPKGPGAGLPDEKRALATISPGQRFTIVVKLHNGSKFPLWIEDTKLEGFDGWLTDAYKGQPATIQAGEDYYANFELQVPQHPAYTRPYWHRDNPEKDSVNAIDEPRYATLPFSPYPFRAYVSYSITGRKDLGLSLHRDQSTILKSTSGPDAEIGSTVVVPFRDERGLEQERELSVVPAFSVALEPGEQVVSVEARSAREEKLSVTSNKDVLQSGILRLEVPSGWGVEPESSKVELQRRGEQQELRFETSPSTLNEGHSEISATLHAESANFREGYTLVTREDLGSFYYFQPAVQHVSIVDVKVPRDLKVGYVMGAGDDIPTVLQQIGMNLTLIPAEKLATENLSQYGSVVLGVRAYDTQKDLVANNPRLLDFVSSGGTLIVQNNNDVSSFNGGHYTPYPATLSRARVSVEEAPMRVLEPDDPIFHFPNQISQKDFDGWVQERGLYFMDKWDDHFTPLLSCHDPNEPDQKGGLLVAKYGKGTYIYTGYAFFRQLPAGVPGAIRLFVNVVSAGHTASH